MKHNANIKFKIKSISPGVIQYLLQKILCVRETVILPCFFEYKKKNFYVTSTFLELFLGCFLLYVL